MGIVQISPLTTTPFQTVSSAATVFNQSHNGGNGVVVLVSTSWATAAAGPTGVTDSFGNTYVLAVQRHISSSSRDVSIWYKDHVQRSGQLTVTASAGNNLNWAVVAIEVSDLWFLGSTNSNTATGTSATAGSITPATPDELLFALIQNGQDGITAPSGFTEIYSNPFIDGEAAYRQASGFPGATNPTWTTSNLEYVAAVASFIAKAPVARPDVKTFLPLIGAPVMSWMIGKRDATYEAPREDFTAPEIQPVIFGPPLVGTPWFFLNRPRPIIAPDRAPEVSPNQIFPRSITEGPPTRMPGMDRRQVTPLPKPEPAAAPGPSQPIELRPFRVSPFRVPALLSKFPTPLPAPPDAPEEAVSVEPGQGLNRPMVPRVPKIGQQGWERRMAGHTEKVAAILNALIRTGVLRQVGKDEWEIVLEE